MADSFIGFEPPRFDIDAVNGAYKEAYNATARAASGSLRDVSIEVVRKGRADIAASGKFRGKWLSAFKYSMRPSGRSSVNAKSYIRHSYGGVARVHEFGATIHGKPLLWLPLPGVPKKTKLGTDFAAGRVQAQKLVSTAGVVAQAKGGLQYRKPNGGRPELGVVVGKGKRAKFKPLFIGIPTVRIKPKWHLTSIMQEGANALPGAFEKKIGHRYV